MFATLTEPWRSVQDWALFVATVAGALAALYAGGAHLIRRLERNFDEMLDARLDEKLDEVRAQLARNGGSTVADAVHEVRRDVKALAAQVNEIDDRVGAIETTLKGHDDDH